jgi:hypothetical protein
MLHEESFGLTQDQAPCIQCHDNYPAISLSDLSDENIKNAGAKSRLCMSNVE